MDNQALALQGAKELYAAAVAHAAKHTHVADVWATVSGRAALHCFVYAAGSSDALPWSDINAMLPVKEVK